jgi:hypothetical protein
VNDFEVVEALKTKDHLDEERPHLGFVKFFVGFGHGLDLFQEVAIIGVFHNDAEG